MSDQAPEILLAHHLKALKLPTCLREHHKLARQCAAEGVDHIRFLARLVEMEMIDRERRMVERRIKAARFPAVKSLDSFDFAAIPRLNKMQVLEMARCEWIERRENAIALGPSGTGKTHVALGLGLAACQKGLSVGFTTAAALVSEMMEARDERRLLRFQKQMAGYKLLIIDELGFVPLSKTGAELLFELISQRYERGSTFITSNLPFDEWTETFGSERLTGALLDRLTHHVSILEMNGESYRLAHSRARKAKTRPGKLHQCRGEWPSGYALTPLPPACNTMAWFYAAEWPTFAPPLTSPRSTTAVTMSPPAARTISTVS
jgi:DNA replication protein DnaC